MIYYPLTYSPSCLSDYPLLYSPLCLCSIIPLPTVHVCPIIPFSTAHCVYVLLSPYLQSTVSMFYYIYILSWLCPPPPSVYSPLCSTDYTSHDVSVPQIYCKLRLCSIMSIFLHDSVNCVCVLPYLYFTMTVKTVSVFYHVYIPPRQCKLCQCSIISIFHHDSENCQCSIMSIFHHDSVTCVYVLSCLYFTMTV